MSSSQQSEPPSPVSHTPEAPGPPAPEALVLRLSPLNLAPITLLVFAVTFPAFAAPALFGWLFAVPVALAYWVLRIRTTIDTDTITARRLLGSRTIAWSDLAGLEFPKRRWARATLTDGSSVILPAATIDDLPRIADASGGRIDNPVEIAAERDAQERSEAAAADSADDSGGEK